MATVEEIREAAESDLLTFIRLVAPHIVMGSVHEDLLNWWTREEGSNNQLCLLPRGHQKSRMIAYRVAWWLTRFPESTILYVSATADLAEKQLYAVKNIIDNKIYRRYWPDMIHPDEGKREKWASMEIAVDHPKRKDEGIRDPSIKAAGLTTNITGFHADVVVLDDCVVPNNAYTEEGRTKVANLYSQLASIENPGSYEWVVGTRYHPADLYSVLMAMHESEYDEDGELVREEPVYELFQKVVEENGEYLWPKTLRKDGKAFGFDAKVLARIKAKYVDTTQFYAQYYNNPNDPGKERINSTKFQYYDKTYLTRNSGSWYYRDRKMNVFAAIDFAFSTMKKADFTAIVVIGIDSDGFVYVLDIDRFKTDSIKEYFDHILKLQNRWDFRKLRAEVTVAQQAVVRELKDSYIRPMGIPLSVDEHRPNRHQGSKEERILANLAPKYDNLSVWHYRGGNCQLLEEELMAQHPEHDDISDAFAAAVEIAVPPANLSNGHNRQNNVVYSSRFGGVSYA